jgi:hypothetical protein
MSTTSSAAEQVEALMLYHRHEALCCPCDRGCEDFEVCSPRQKALAFADLPAQIKALEARNTKLEKVVEAAKALIYMSTAPWPEWKALECSLAIYLGPDRRPFFGEDSLADLDKA